MSDKGNASEQGIRDVSRHVKSDLGLSPSCCKLWEGPNVQGAVLTHRGKLQKREGGKEREEARSRTMEICSQREDCCVKRDSDSSISLSLFIPLPHSRCIEGDGTALQ